jgi:hypothetical protein
MPIGIGGSLTAAQFDLLRLEVLPADQLWSNGFQAETPRRRNSGVRTHARGNLE